MREIKIAVKTLLFSNSLDHANSKLIPEKPNHQIHIENKIVELSDSKRARNTHQRKG